MALLEGLEAVEIKFSDLFVKNELVRVDSEPFTFKFKKMNTNIPTDKLDDLVDFNPSKLEIQQDIKKASFLSMSSISSGYINTMENVDVEEYKSGYTYFQENDILVATITPCMEHGKCTIASNLTNKLGFGSTELIVMREKENPKILKEYLLSYLNREIIRNKAKSYFIGTSGRQRVPSYFYKNLDIPLLSMDFQKEIKTLHLQSETLRQQSKTLYTQAEEILLEELGLQDFKPSKEPVNIKSFKDSFGVSGRLDAEYYQKKYEQVIERIISKKYDTLSNIVTINKSIEPGSDNYDDNGLPFLRVADYSKFGLTEPQKYLKESFVADDKVKIENLKPKKGTILFSKDGSVGTAYHLREDFNGITSGAILHLSVKDESKIISEYLTLVLNSKLVQMQAERDAGGSIILHWRVSEIENVVVPIIDFDKQQQIANLIEESFSLKKQSEHLLEVAKKSVEIAIEENETVAMEFIKTHIFV